MCAHKIENTRLYIYKVCSSFGYYTYNTSVNTHTHESKLTTCGANVLRARTLCLCCHHVSGRVPVCLMLVRGIKDVDDDENDDAM